MQGLGPGSAPATPPSGSGIAQHRRAPRVRVGAILSALVVAAVVVVLGGAAAGTRLTADQRLREFVVSGTVGEPVSTGEFEVTVLDVATAAEIDAGGPLLNTAGIWVSVTLLAAAVDSPTSIDYAAVRDSTGRTWLATPRVRQPLLQGGHRLEPGLTVQVDVVFEVSADAATELTFRTGQRRDLRLDTVAEVELPVDPGRVDRIVAESTAETESEPDSGSASDPGSEARSGSAPEPRLEPVPVRLTPEVNLDGLIGSKSARRSGA